MIRETYFDCGRRESNPPSVEEIHKTQRPYLEGVQTRNPRPAYVVHSGICHPGGTAIPSRSTAPGFDIRKANNPGAFQMKPPGERFRAQPEHHSRLWLMVGQDGFEPATNGLKIRCSSAELLPHRSAGIRRTVIRKTCEPWAAHLAGNLRAISTTAVPRFQMIRSTRFGGTGRIRTGALLNGLRRGCIRCLRLCCSSTLSYCPILPPGNPVTQREVFAVCHILLLQRDIEWQSRRPIFARAG